MHVPVQAEPITKLHLVFKTHLDLGFTNLANVVYRHYMDDFIPGALQLARTLRERESPDRFVWTTGSWLIYHYLEEASTADRKQMEAALEAGDIAWHALPFTTHTELIDADLFRFGLSLSQKLDEQFGRKTIAAKMTDVPGHTRAIVPLMAEAGIKLMHIGVNEASTMPHVPPVFIWRDEASGHELLMIYEHHYGGVVQVNGLHEALVLQMTGDNMGPPTVAAVEHVYRDLRTRFPSAEIVPTTLDTFAAALEAVRDQLPVLTDEIGDSWIHGVGTDPQKVRAWRELMYLRRDILASSNPVPEKALTRFQDRLLCVAEHTWGMDTKIHLGEYESYRAEEFSAARSTPPFLTMETSWEEQRAYLDHAVAALTSTPWHETAIDALKTPRLLPPADGKTDERTFITRQFEIGIDSATGAINHLETRANGRTWASPDHPLALFRYETLDQDAYDRFWDEYIQGKDRETITAWARPDYTKPGIAGKAVRIPPTSLKLDSLYAEQNHSGLSLSVVLKSPAEWTQAYGAPPLIDVRFLFHEDVPQIDVQLSWKDKPACRLPEALWLSFVPLAPDAQWRFEKLGQWIDPTHVVSGGARGLHAVFDRVTCLQENRQMTLVTHHAPLVAPGAPQLLRFPNHLPDMNGGVHINLFNNAWGTNFPQWNEGDASFDLQLRWD
jgi:hypothetical protein